LARTFLRLALATIRAAWGTPRVFARAAALEAMFAVEQLCGTESKTNDRRRDAVATKVEVGADALLTHSNA
jgi:hypothetical protein